MAYSFLTYLRLKATAILLRLIIRFVGAPINPHQTSTLHIPSRNPNRTIEGHLYKPHNSSSATTTTTTDAGPLLLNFHGSGFVLPRHGEDDDFCLQIAREANYTVLDISYRLAPEHPFPAAPHDVEDAVKWALSQNPRYTKIALSGFSAGANLALTAAGAIFEKGTFSAVLAFYPPCDLAVEPTSKRAPDAEGRPIPAFLANFFDSTYVGGADPRSPMISPRFAPPETLPEDVLVVTAAGDSLCLEAEAWAAKVREAKGERRVVTYRAEKCNHAWDKGTVPGTVQMKAREEAYSLAVDMLKR